MLNVTKTLSTTFDMESLSNVFMNLLPSLGISFCFIALYEDKIDNSLTPSKTSQIFLNFVDGKCVEADKQAMKFDTNELMPDPIWRKADKSCFLIYPLVTENIHFGYIIFQHHIIHDPNIYETLQGHLSASLNTSSLMETIKKQTRDLESLLGDQKKKSGELELAYKSLKENQEKILVIEKMASLGRMTAGLSHEMHTPLATIRSSLYELERLKNEYYMSIEDSEISLDDHHNIAYDMQKSIANAQKAAEFLTIFIKGIKSQTTDLMPKENCIFDAIPVIKDTILLLNHKINVSKCRVVLSAAEQSVLIYGFSARLSQILMNLVNNAIYACKERKDGTIKVSIGTVADMVELTVEDNGTGIDKEILSKIFDPLFTTKSFAEGTGLGLTIVYNIITAEFNGNIEVKSEVGKGTAFIIHFPKPVVKEI
jgi:signal transduction histidine kinase